LHRNLLDLSIHHAHEPISFVRFCGPYADNHSQAFRRLNAVSVPKMVGVPNNAEEDAKRGN